MTESTKNLVLGILYSMKGDNLARATLSFRGMDLTKQHGESGKTRQQILDEYIKDRAEINAAISEIRGL